MIEAQVLGEDQDPSLDRYLKEWLAHARGRVRVTTYAGYEYLIRVHAVPALGDVRLSELSPLHFQRLYPPLPSTPRPRRDGPAAPWRSRGPSDPSSSARAPTRPSAGRGHRRGRTSIS